MPQGSHPRRLAPRPTPLPQIVHEAIRTRQRSRQNTQAGGGGGAAQPPACVLNAEDRDSVFAISPDGLRCQARSEQSWGGCRGTVGAFGRRVYYEATVSDEGLCRWVVGGAGRGGGSGQARIWVCMLWAAHSGRRESQCAWRCPSRAPPVSFPSRRLVPLSRVGWSTQAASLDLGTDRHSFGYGGTGKKSHNRSFDGYGEVRRQGGGGGGGFCPSPGNPVTLPAKLQTALPACNAAKPGPPVSHLMFERPLLPPAQPYGLNDTIGCLLDCEGSTIAFSKNGAVLGPAFQLPQVWGGRAGACAAGRGALVHAQPDAVALLCKQRAAKCLPAPPPTRANQPLFLQYLQGQALYPAICLKNAELQVNFGAVRCFSDFVLHFDATLAPAGACWHSCAQVSARCTRCLPLTHAPSPLAPLHPQTPFKHGPPPGFVGLAAAPRSATASWQDAPSASGADRKPLAIILEPARWVVRNR